MKKFIYKTISRKNLFFTFLLINISVYSQIDVNNINESPYNVIHNHSYYLKEASYNPSKAALSLPRSINNKKEIAIKLKKVLDGKGINIGFIKIPKNSNYIDSLSHSEIFYLYPIERRIYVEKVKGKWYYSKETINQLSNLYNEIYIFDLNIKKYFHSEFWYKKLLGLTFIKWLGLILLFLVCYVVQFISKKIFYFFVKKYIKTKFTLTATILNEIKKSSKYFGLFVAAKIFNILLPQLHLSAAWNAFLLRIFSIIAILLLITLINKIIDTSFIYFKEKVDNIRENQLLKIIRRVLKTVIWVLGAIYILQYLGVNVITILTGLSIGGLAFALAAQDTVKNLIASVLIFIDKPFQIDDWVKFNDVEGVIEEIGVRSTRIRTFEDTLVYVPNNILANNVVNNIGLRKYRRFKIIFNINNITTVKTIDYFINELKTMIKNHPHTVNGKFNVCLYDMNNGLPSIMLSCFFDVNSNEEELKCRHDILSEMLSIAEKEGVDFAFPSNSVYINSTKKDIT